MWNIKWCLSNAVQRATVQGCLYISDWKKNNWLFQKHDAQICHGLIQKREWENSACEKKPCIVNFILFCTYYILLHEWKFSPSPIGLNRGWAKKYNAIATSGDVIRGRYNARLVSRQILLVADNIIGVSLWLMRHMCSSNISFTNFM